MRAPTVRSGKLFSFVTSGSRGWAKYYSESGPAFLRVGNLDHDSISLDLRDVQRITPPSGAEGSRTRVKPDDILISITADVGMVGIVPPGFEEAYINQHVALARPVDGVYPAYLAWYLASPSAQRQFRDLQRGATKVGLGLDDIRTVDVPLPSFGEQRRIVAEIEQQFTRLEVGVTALRQVQVKLKRYRAAVLQAACEGRLVPTEAELARQEGRPYEPASELLVRILKRRKIASGRSKDDARPSLDDAYPPLPTGWVWTNIGQLRMFSLYGPRFSSDNYADDGYVILRTSDISESGKVNITKAPRLRLTETDFKKYQAQKGDLLITRTGSLGTLAVFDDDVEAIPGAYLIQFRLATEPVTTRYLFYFLKSPVGQSYLAGKGAGVGRPNLNAPTIEALSVPLPPLAEQTRIVAEVERRLSVVEDLGTTVIATLQRAVRFRQSILQKAFAGKLI